MLNYRKNFGTEQMSKASPQNCFTNQVFTDQRQIYDGKHFLLVIILPRILTYHTWLQLFSRMKYINDRSGLTQSS